MFDDFCLDGIHDDFEDPTSENDNYNIDPNEDNYDEDTNNDGMENNEKLGNVYRGRIRERVGYSSKLEC